MKTHKVISSNLERAGYDEDKQSMHVEFKNGKSYEYQNVPKHVYQGIFKSESPGEFFSKWVIKSKYKAKKLK